MTKRKRVLPKPLAAPEVGEQIERLIYQNADDIAVSISRSFERLEERVDAMEGRLHSRLAELADQVAELMHPIAAH